MNAILPKTTLLRSVAAFLALAGFLVTCCAPKTLACLLKLKLKGEEAKFSGTIEFFYKRPDVFSFYPRTFFGMGGFKARGEGDSLTIYFPKQNEFYRGTLSDFESTALWGSEISLDMLLEMILAKGGASAEEFRYAGRENDALLYDVEEEDWIKRYWIDSRRCRFTQSRWTDKTEEVVYEVEYRDFKTQGGAETPRSVKIKSSSGDSAALKFLERKFDLEIPAGKFDLQIPSDAEQVTFKTPKK